MTQENTQTPEMDITGNPMDMINHWEYPMDNFLSDLDALVEESVDDQLHERFEDIANLINLTWYQFCRWRISFATLLKKLNLIRYDILNDQMELPDNIHRNCIGDLIEDFYETNKLQHWSKRLGADI